VAAVRTGWDGTAARLRWAPEWQVAVLVALAWAALLAGAGAHGAPAGHEQHVHAHDAGLHAALGGWTLMVIAMMVPVTLPAVRHVGLNSIRPRRQWAMALYTCVYVTVWVGFGAVALLAVRGLHEALMLDDRALLVCALIVAATWQLTRAKRRAVLACKRTVPLPPVGRRADLGCARFAVSQAWRCMCSCWALMGVMALAGHASLLWMAGLTALIAVEELTLAGRGRLGHGGAVLAVAAAAVALGA
jgi:predicted metal-binding membrane protein